MELMDERSFSLLLETLRSYKTGSGNLAAEQLEAMQEEKQRFHEHMERNLNGECICPKRDNPNPKSEHFPGCPVRLQEEIDKLKGMLFKMDDLIMESVGVDGLHMNGDVAPWQELKTGGEFDAWLGGFDELLESIRSGEHTQS